MKVWINNVSYPLPVNQGELPLLEFLRGNLGLMGTRYGCGMGLCGACTVHLNGKAVRACQTPVKSLAGKRITTIEGLAKNNNLHPVQQAFIKFQVPQCGFCMSGQIMSGAALLENNPRPTRKQVNIAMSGNLCRCGTYQRIRKALLAMGKGAK